jgi:hypothetical protein
LGRFAGELPILCVGRPLWYQISTGRINQLGSICKALNNGSVEVEGPINVYPD